MSVDSDGEHNGLKGGATPKSAGFELPRVLHSGPKKPTPPANDPQVLLDKLEVQLRMRFDTCLTLVQATQREYLACLEGNKTILSSVEPVSVFEEIMPTSPENCRLTRSFQSDLERLGEDETHFSEPVRLNSGFTRQSSDSTATVSSSMGDRRDSTLSQKQGRLLRNMTLTYPENKRRKKAMRQVEKKETSRLLSDRVNYEPSWRVRTQRIVASQAFQCAVFLAIFSNSLFLGYEVNEMAVHPTDSRPAGFLVIDGVYTAFFLGELLFRGISEGCRSFWWSRDWHWNIFDVLVIATSVLELVLPLVMLNNSGTMDLTFLRTFRFIRVTRLLRTLRIVRLVRFIRSLRTLLHSIVYTLRSVFWALLLMLMIFYGFGVAFTQAAGDHRRDKEQEMKSKQSDDMEKWEVERENLDKYWQDLPTSMFTLFQSVTSGINWAEAANPLRTIGSHWVWFFIFFIVFMVWVVVNVITGFFCQSAIESAQHDMDLATAQLISKWQENKKFLESIFIAMDTDNSGMVTLKELEACLQNEQMQAYLSSLGIEAVDAWTLLKLLDVNESGTVELEEFILGCMQLRGGAKAVHVARLAYDQRQMNTVLEEFIAHVNVQLAALSSALSSLSPGQLISLRVSGV